MRQDVWRGFREQQRPPRRAGDGRPRVAVHFRWGEFGHVCQGKRATRAGSACANATEIALFYNSNMDAILHILGRLGGLVRAFADADLVLFSTGKVHEEPFTTFQRAYPHATLEVVEEGEDAVSGSERPDPLVASVFAMADADVLITSCGKFSYLMGILNRGVKFTARGCMESPALWKGRGVEYDLETGVFDPAQFERSWQDYMVGAEASHQAL